MNTNSSRDQRFSAACSTLIESPPECVPAQTLLSAFSSITSSRPHAIAACDVQAACTFAQLDHRANFLASRLLKAGAQPATPVALLLPRSLDLLAGILAVFKLGAFYLPLDPELPRSHVQLCLNDAHATVLTTAPVARTFGFVNAVLVDKPGVAATFQCPSPLPQDKAVLLYTSGVSSTPKPVELTHAALVHALFALRDAIAFSSSDLLLAAAPVSSSIATLELLLPLLFGAQVVLATRDQATDPWHLSRLIETSGCTVFHAAPSTWQALLSIGWHPPRPIKALSSGAVLPRETANRLLDLGLELWNLYGSPETTAWSLVHRVRPGNGDVPIGRTIGDTQAVVLDRQQNPLPPNVPGELCLGGASLAQGYRGQPALTARFFFQLPSDPATRLYRTGDRAICREDGTLEYQGPIASSPARRTTPPALTQPFPGWSQTQRTIAALWMEVLRVPVTSLDDSFFDLGGNSLVVARLQHRFTSTFGRPVTMAALFHTPVLRQQAAFVESLLAARNPRPSGILALQPSGTRPPLFWFHPTALVRNLSAGLGNDQPLIASVLTPEDIERVRPAPSMEAIAARHAAAILAVRPNGPFYLGGYCVGGVVAYAVANHLIAAGHSVELVILLDSQNPVFYRRIDRFSVELSKVRFYFSRALRRNHSTTSLSERLLDRLRAIIRSTAPPATEMSAAEQLTNLASGTYRPPPYSGNVLLLQPQERPAKVNYLPGWLPVISPNLEVEDVPGQHDELLTAENAPAVAAAMARRIRTRESSRTQTLRAKLKSSA